MKKETKNLVAFITLCIFAAVLLCVAVLTSFDYETEKLEVTFVYVGQGDCAYIKTPDGHRFLIDGGEESAYSEYLKKFFLRRFVQQIDMGVVSHFHSDHAGGIIAMLEDDMTEKIVCPESAEQTLIGEQLFKTASAHGAQVLKRGFDNVLYQDKDGVKISALFPNKGLYVNSGEDYDENNNSLVLKLEYAGRSFLFTGDIEKEAEEALCETTLFIPGVLGADVLKVPHHGSSTSLSESFLRHINPRYAVISCGEDNSYGFPSSEVTERLKSCETTVFETDLNGDITFFVSENGEMEIKKQR